MTFISVHEPHMRKIKQLTSAIPRVTINLSKL